MIRVLEGPRWQALSDGVRQKEGREGGEEGGLLPRGAQLHLRIRLLRFLLLEEAVRGPVAGWVWPPPHVEGKSSRQTSIEKSLIARRRQSCSESMAAQSETESRLKMGSLWVPPTVPPWSGTSKTGESEPLELSRSERELSEGVRGRAEVTGVPGAAEK